MDFLGPQSMSSEKTSTNFCERLKLMAECYAQKHGTLGYAELLYNITQATISEHTIDCTEKSVEREKIKHSTRGLLYADHECVS